MMRSLPSRQTCFCLGLTAVLLTVLLVSSPTRALGADRMVICEYFTSTG